MKSYKVIVTPEAEKELKGYIAYLRSVKKQTLVPVTVNKV